jgi:hypothetical protein
VKDVVASTLRALSSRTLLVGGRDESAGAGAAEHRERVAAERLVEHGLKNARSRPPRFVRYQVRPAWECCRRLDRALRVREQ